MQVDVLNFGFKFAEKHFIHLQAQTFANIKFGYNNGLINLLRYGFADSSNIGTRVTITNFGLRSRLIVKLVLDILIN